MSGIKAARAGVFEYLLKHPGGTVFLGDLCRDHPDATRASIQQVMRHAVQQGLAAPIVQGNSWRVLAPNANGTSLDTHALFEQIGRTKTGDPVLQSEDGTLYVAREVS
jgi:hypothetical protein